MPIYAYKCNACGYAKDILQKMSDPVLTTCPQCTAQAFSKQVTAAGFQLKGSGWYVTDFRGGNSAAPAADGSKDSSKASDAPAAPATPNTTAAPTATAAASPVSAPATKSVAASAAPTGSSS
jgi:putative FmdB family regulatory protein